MKYFVNIKGSDGVYKEVAEFSAMEDAFKTVMQIVNKIYEEIDRSELFEAVVRGVAIDMIRDKEADEIIIDIVLKTKGFYVYSKGCE